MRLPYYSDVAPAFFKTFCLFSKIAAKTIPCRNICSDKGTTTGGGATPINPYVPTHNANGGHAMTTTRSRFKTALDNGTT